jgi:hypothetical protein
MFKRLLKRGEISGWTDNNIESPKNASVSLNNPLGARPRTYPSLVRSHLL